ncbi:hypothetical protein BKM09_032435 (plasmid) [Pseudomonas amygdali pv. morsprunorum]|nr:PBECR2 nuclease fold domain-containing protein [Pseudomonas amygdali]POY47892.1 hypothetical protein BKM09_032435 [Pseudomonas amygdali pv. morsprunorum]
MIKELPGQSGWEDLGLPDLRYHVRELRSPAISEIKRGDTFEEALAIIHEHFGMSVPTVTSRTFETPVGSVTVLKPSLAHIVEKRPDSRERYVRHAIDTLSGPFEVWRVQYDNGDYRLAFVGAYEAKNDMLVIVDVKGGNILWNFMHCSSKKMNPHRRGELLYRRYEIESKEKGQL